MSAAFTVTAQGADFRGQAEYRPDVDGLRAVAVLLVVGAAILGFAEIAEEMVEGDTRALDEAILLGDRVIVMTARSAVSDRVDALDTGADDYITKPFDFAELEARCRAVLRRRGGVAQATRAFADLVFDQMAATLAVAGDLRDLRTREMRLMELFIAAPGRILSKEHLVDRLFSFSEPVSDNAIEVYVGRLRKKMLGSRARIETVRGLGYRLTETPE